MRSHFPKSRRTHCNKVSCEKKNYYQTSDKVLHIFGAGKNWICTMFIFCSSFLIWIRKKNIIFNFFSYIKWMICLNRPHLLRRKMVKLRTLLIFNLPKPLSSVFSWEVILQIEICANLAISKLASIWDNFVQRDDISFVFFPVFHLVFI